jgi:hypothetical protein
MVLVEEGLYLAHLIAKILTAIHGSRHLGAHLRLIWKLGLCHLRPQRAEFHFLSRQLDYLTLCRQQCQDGD